MRKQSRGKFPFVAEGGLSDSASHPGRSKAVLCVFAQLLVMPSIPICHSDTLEVVSGDFATEMQTVDQGKMADALMLASIGWTIVVGDRVLPE